MTSVSTEFYFSKEWLQHLLDELCDQKFQVVGPTIDQGAIVYDTLESVEQLPRGWTDEQAPGHYRLVQRDDDAWFGYSVGPHSWKKYLFPPKSNLLTAVNTEAGWQFIPPCPDVPRYALLGVRACELAALRIQDQVFLEGAHPDPIYQQRRASLFVIAVNCTQAASTCFCTSMKTGPRCRSGFDLALTEIETGFVCEVGSPAGQTMLDAALSRQAISDPSKLDADSAQTVESIKQNSIPSEEQFSRAEQARQQAIDQIQRQLDTSDLPGLLLGNLDHPHWQKVGERCLSCTNCTMVCPTCFCSSVTEVRDLNQDRIERERSWDSCFNPDFSYLGGSLVRNDTASRYRQWLTHKLDGWHAQFGSSGCVGCGRCITWCPVGIDLTAEVAAIREVPTT